MVKKNVGGRPTLYREEFADDLIKFFDIEPFHEVNEMDGKGGTRTRLMPNKFPTLARFACNCGVTRDTLYEWATGKDENGELKHPKFSYAYKRAKEYQESLLVEGTMNGAYNAPFAIFSAKNILGWKDKHEQEVTGANAGPLVISLNNLDESA
jgi:hypothetical protein